MKIPTTVICLIILSTAKASPLNSSVEECTEKCPRIFAPVCAVFKKQNGDIVKEKRSETKAVYRYFANDCLRQYASCSSGEIWRPTSMSLCLEHIDPLILAQCLRPCPFIYDPICATDGIAKKLFGNSCVLEVENCLSIETWSLADDSECVEDFPKASDHDED